MKIRIIIIAIPLLASLSCQQAKNPTDTLQDSEGYAAQSAGAVAGFFADESETASLQSTGIGTCSLATARSGCGSGTADTINWNSCTVGTATLTGGWTETYNTNAACATSQSAALPNGDSVILTSPASIATFSDGSNLQTDTTAHETYSGVYLPGTGVTVTATDGTGGRTIQINTIHRLLKGPHGMIWFSHSVIGNLTLAGTKAGSNRVLTGTTTTYHNVTRYTATSTFNAVTWGTSTCCYPTSGNIQTSFSGSITGSSTLTYTGCGTATYTDTSGNNSNLTLNYCQ